ncbi:MAG TPA: ferritin-like protein [Actinomycetota bacterium]|nr:ferritin-like protein [Actinomycetota bacterium]
MLTEAAELEHAIMCQYLFASFSLKKNVDEGVTDRQLDRIHRWDRIIRNVAAEEMLHLAQVNNLLLAVGAAPRVGRPNLPQHARHYPPGVQLALLPFGERALRHFLYLERPEGINLPDAEGFDVVDESEPLMTEEDIVPRPQDFATIGHLYRSIEEGIRNLVERHGERWLFVGTPKAQASPELFRWKDLVEVTDLAGALRGLEVIVEQGEGPRGHWRDAHYGRFLEVLGEYLTLKREDSAFEPARPVLPVFVRRAADADGPLVSDPMTARVLDAFNVTNEILLHVLARFFGHGEETDEQVRCLSDVAVMLMITVLKPLGELATTMPVGPSHHGVTAGPSFELFYGSGYMLPHRRAAWFLIHERLVELAAFVEATSARPDAPEALPGITTAVRSLADRMSECMPELAERQVGLPPMWLGRHRPTDPQAGDPHQ